MTLDLKTVRTDSGVCLKVLVAIILLLSSLLVESSLAELEVKREEIKESILQPIGDLSIYDNPSENNWLIASHGLRFAALHRTVWGTRKDQRTQSHRIIPIKTFYLRSSENSNYRLKQLRVVFSFDGASIKVMKREPSTVDPVLEIGFGGEYISQGGKEPIRDRGYSIRLSAVPSISSGIYYRSQLKMLLLQQPPKPNISTKKVHTLVGQFSDEKASFTLNGESWGEISQPGVNRGLISIVSAWHPIRISKLEFEGTQFEGNLQTEVKESGLVGGIKASRRSKVKGKKSPGGNEVLDQMLLRNTGDELNDTQGSGNPQ